MLILPNIPDRYDARAERDRNDVIQRADNDNLKRNQDIELVGIRLILRSPDGSRWSITVDDLGVVGATALPDIA